MFSKLFIVVGFLLFFSGIAKAEEGRVGIYIDAVKSKIVLALGAKTSGGTLANAGWLKKEGKSNCYAVFKSNLLTDEEWKSCEFSFTPDKDGKVKLILLGSVVKDKVTKKPLEIWYFFDDIQISGADLVNGDFSETDKKGRPKGWWIKDVKQYIDDNGNKYVKVKAGASCVQFISVKEGKEIIVKAKFRFKTAK